MHTPSARVLLARGVQKWHDGSWKTLLRGGRRWNFSTPRFQRLCACGGVTLPRRDASNQTLQGGFEGCQAHFLWTNSTVCWCTFPQIPHVEVGTDGLSHGTVSGRWFHAKALFRVFMWDWWDWWDRTRVRSPTPDARTRVIGRETEGRTRQLRQTRTVTSGRNASLVCPQKSGPP